MNEKLSATRVWFGSLGFIFGGLFSLIAGNEKWLLFVVYVPCFLLLAFILDKIYGEDK